MNRKWVTAGIVGSYLLLFLTLLMLNPKLFVYPLLEKPFVPLGNALFWVALIAFPIFLEAASSGFGKAFPWWSGKVQLGFKAALVLAALWWPLSYGLSGNFAKIMKWADQHRTLQVRTNADTPHDSRQAREFGAQGIGLCRTERMFNAVERLPVVIEMIVAETTEQREAALDQLLAQMTGPT